ncbi:MAG: hypothetical protein OEZ58_14900 [Gammaproteobacteria bacterium]|nr:hypothetical protein [Gammaproteobacteria bacterium]MDH5730283.1 hypothetical protein [Gammaproteobacteria bacterium]
MNKDDLQRKLSEEKFNPSSYSLEEEQKDEALCLRCENGRWCVYYSERGLQTGKECFEDESSACEFFLEEMRSDPTTKSDWKSGFSM